MDDEVVREASRQEVIRRYYKTACEYKKGYADRETFERSLFIMEDMGLKLSDRKVVEPAKEAAAEMERRAVAKGINDKNAVYSAVAIELEDGTIVNGKGSELMTATAAAMLNATKTMAGLADELHLIAPAVLEPMQKLKSETLGSKSPALNCEEILMALTICAATNPMAQVCVDHLKDFKGCQAHSTTIFSRADEECLRKLGIDATCEAVYPSDNLYYNI